MTHTPGPWTAYYDERRDNYQIFGPGKLGAWICNTKCETVPKSHKDNSTLIAAAPDLLKAAKIGLKYIESEMGSDTTERDFVLTTIKKAEGRL